MRMKVFYCYVSTTIAEHYRFGDPKGTYYKKIEEHLTKLGHSVDEFSYTVSTSAEDKLEQNWNVNAAEVLGRVYKADVVVAEMSFASQTLGFLLGLAVSRGKPCLYLYQPGYSGKPASPLVNNPSRLLTVKSFTNEDSLSRTLSQFMRKAEKQLRSDRTTFVTTRFINDYLKWKIEQTGLSKGEVIRGALEAAIESTPEYEGSD